MKGNFYFFIIATILFFTACKTETEKQIVGKWNAAKLVECDEVIPIDTSLVNLEFLSDGRYIFNSTLKVHEEGKYHLQDNYLFTHDLLNAKAPQNVVLIKILSPDSLVLEMNQKGKEQWLTLYRHGKNDFAQENRQNEPQKASLETFTPPNVATNSPDSVVTAPSALSGSVAITQPPLSSKTPEAAIDDKTLDDNAAFAHLSPSEAAEAKRKADREAYLKREEKRKEEAEAKRRAERAAYLKREEKRRENEADRKRERAEYLKREAARKKTRK